MNERVVHFTDLKVWQKAHKVFLDFTDDVKELPNSIVNREIIRQLIRSIGSISANISEGFNSQSTKEYLRFLDIARRSTAESENWFYKLRDLKTLDRKKVDQRIESCIEITKMLYGLKKTLSNKLKH